jgi:hypothetical protein
MTMNLSLFLIAGPDLSWLSDFDNNQRFALTIIGIGCVTVAVIALTSVIAGILHRVKESQIEADLKRDMLDRGMTAEEIQKVIEATPQNGFDRWIGSWCKKK